MSTSSTVNKSLGLRAWIAASFVLVACAIFAMTREAHAAPPAGTVISNQATATYQDAGGTNRTATSNLVTTVVAQVKSFTLAANGARAAAPGATVYYPHTITNTGNGTDTYTLNAATSTNFLAAAAPHGSLAYYIDANSDGLPDNATPIFTSGAIAAGGTFRFVVAGVVPSAAASGNTADITVSVSDTQVTTTTNTDTTTVANSVITVNKSIGPVTSGPSPSVALTVTLSYTNSGTAVANNLTITDVLPTSPTPPTALMVFVPGSGRWSVSGTNPLTDLSDGIEQAGTPPGIDFRSSGNTVTAIIGSVPAGVSGTVTFQVNVPAGVTPRTVSNVASFTTSTQTTPTFTNPATYTVLQTALVVANGSAASSVNLTNEPVTVPSAAPGSTVLFDNYVWNKGNGTDTFDMTIVANSFPAGSTVSLLQADGVTSLLNSAGAGAPDTGPIPGQGSACPAPLVTDGTFCGYRVVVRVTLPAAVAPGSYSLTKRATSVFNTGVIDDVTDTLATINGNTVDVTNNTARSDSTPAGTATSANSATTGWGPSSGLVVTSQNATPSISGATTWRFRLHVNNTGFVSDSFNLTATLAATTAPGVTVPTLPAGWSVLFHADGGLGNCSTVGGSLVNTGALAAGANRIVCVQVTVPATTTGNAIPGNYDFDFRVESATNVAVNDTKRDRITVDVVRAITLTPNNSQQTFPGGSVTYVHTLTNTGNAIDTATFAAGCTTDSRAGWTSAVYIDANGNGTLQVPPGAGTDTLVTCGSTTQPLNPGEARTVFVRVFAFSGATAADPANLTTITVTYGAATTNAIDTTSVTDGLVMTKEQTTVACAFAGPHVAPAYTTGAIGASAATAPGQCIAYRVTATNSTAGTITAVAITDNVPPNTKMNFACSGNGIATPSVTPGAMAGGSAVNGAGGQVIANVGALSSTQTATLYFCVRIDP